MRRLMLTIILVACMCSNASALNWHWFYQTGPYDTLRYRNIGWGCSGFYGGRSYDQGLNRIISGGTLALGAYQVANNVQLQKRVITMAEKEQDFQHKQQQQVVVYQQSVAGPVLNRSNEEIRARFKQQEAEKAKMEEIKKLQAEVEKLKLELEKIKLEKELEQAKKTK